MMRTYIVMIVLMIPVVIIYNSGPGITNWNLGNLGFTEAKCVMQSTDRTLT